jgi:N-acetylmuramoyl-L-alanine amidase
VRHWSYAEYTRVVVEFDRPIRAQNLKRLAADPGARRGERLYLDVDGIWVGRRYVDGVPVGDGLLKAIRLGQNTLTRTRVVIDVEQYADHRVITLTHPDRLVVDVYGSRKAARGQQSAVEGRRLSWEFRPVRTIVVDAGHGGKDPGAMGIGGLREKDLTLHMAKALGRRLSTKGFNVVYTRDRDRTIDLEERTAIAEAAQGDLFISLHANASRRRSLRGIETYYPAHNHERHTLTVAARENGLKRHEVNALQKTLARLRVSEASSASQRLAQLVHGRVVEGIDKQYGSVVDLGVKKGPFYVLFLSNMPAILVEAGFLTNRQDAKRLREKKYLDRVAADIAAGLDLYSRDPTAVAMGKER